MLIGRILSTLGTEYIFKGVRDAIPTSKQTVNLFTEKLCAFKLRAKKLASAEATAFVAHKNDKRKSNSTKVNSCKSTKRGADRATQKCLCNQCKGCGVSSKAAACRGQRW